MDAPAFRREVVEQGVEGGQLAFGDVRARARFRESRLVVLLRLAMEAVALPQDAPAPVLAAVADERGFVQPLAPLLDKRGAVGVTPAAEFAQSVPVVLAARADVLLRALHLERAPVRDAAGRALVRFDGAGPDLPHDRRHGV